MNVERVAQVLARGRDHAESLMQDQCTITIPGEGEGTYDPGTNTTIPPDPVVIYPVAPSTDGRCRIRLALPVSDRPMVAVDQKTVVSHKISIPVSAPPVPKNATLTITASTHDPANVGRVFTIRSGVRETHATAYRLDAEEIQLEEVS